MPSGENINKIKIHNQTNVTNLPFLAVMGYAYKKQSLIGKQEPHKKHYYDSYITESWTLIIKF